MTLLPNRMPLLFAGMALAAPVNLAFFRPAPRGGQSGTVAIVGATLIDGTGAPPLSNSIVVVERGHVSCVGGKTACTVPGGARIVDGAGRWLMPGLFDAHVHISEEHGQFGPLYLAFGITSVRDVGGYADTLRNMRAAVAAGAMIGPRIYMAGNPIDGDPPH